MPDDDKKDDVLNLLADCQLTIEYDADMTEGGSQIDCSTFTLSGSLYSLGIFLEAFGISRRYEESWEDAVTREIEADEHGVSAEREPPDDNDNDDGHER